MTPKLTDVGNSKTCCVTLGRRPCLSVPPILACDERERGCFGTEVKAKHLRNRECTGAAAPPVVEEPGTCGRVLIPQRQAGTGGGGLAEGRKSATLLLLPSLQSSLMGGLWECATQAGDRKLGMAATCPPTTGKNPTDEYLEGMMSEAPGPINFTMFLTMFGEKLNGTDPEDVIRNAFACFDEEASGQCTMATWAGCRALQGEGPDVTVPRFPVAHLPRLPTSGYTCQPRTHGLNASRNQTMSSFSLQLPPQPSSPPQVPQPSQTL